MDEGQRECARGDWCSGRTVEIRDKERIVTPAATYLPYCRACETWITVVLEDPADGMAALYGRLEAAIGDQLQADVHVPAPFGPQIEMRLDIDAHMRMTADILGGWCARVRAARKLTANQHPHGSPEAVADDAAKLAGHMTVLMALQPGPMRRTYRLPLHPEVADRIAAAEILAVTDTDLTALEEVGAEDAGREILYLHYGARKALLETNPPPEPLRAPCRLCTPPSRSLRRAWPDGPEDRDLYSRCGACGDEMGYDEYAQNALRWHAYYRAHQERPVLTPLR